MPWNSQVHSKFKQGETALHRPGFLFLKILYDNCEKVLLIVEI